MTKSKNAGKMLYVQLNRDETRLSLLAGPESPSLVLQTPAGAVGDGVIQNVDAVRTLLKTALQQPEFKGCRRVVFSLCTSQVISEVASDIPGNLTGKNLEKAILNNADTYFPVVDLQDYKLVWQVIGPKDGDSREQLVQLWAVPINMLSRYYQVANACNLVVERIDYCGNSVATAVGASFAQSVRAKERPKLNLKADISFGKKKEAPAQPEAETVPVQQPATQLHVLLEGDMVGVTFVQNNRVMMQRFVRCGAHPALQFDELAMMVEYYSSLEMGRGSAITGFACGGLATNRALVEELADTLGVPMQVINFGYDPKWTLCLGAAAGTLDFGIPSLNVMKAGRQVESQLWQYILLLVAGVALVGMVMLTMTSRLGWESEISSLESQQKTLMIQVRKTSGYSDKYNKYNSEYSKYSADWETIFTNLRTYNDNLVLALQELEATLPENTSVKNLQISTDGLTVQFSCSSKEEAAYLIMALREMEYMDLVYISNLTGGGGGPVNSYGPEEEEYGTEAPPTEGDFGDLSDQEVKLLAELLAANIDQGELMTVFMGLSEGEIQRLENVYGNKPTNHYGSLEMLRGAYATKNIFEKRSAALKEMLTTNPFAIRRFTDLVMADVWAPEPILLWYIYDDLLLPENSDLLDMLMGDGSLGNAEQAYGMMERMIAIITKSEESLTAAEDLMCTDAKMERWYVYYLEMELGLQEKTALGFLDMERVLADLMEGSFDTGDKTLDKKLNKLVPKEVWDALEQIKNQGGGGGNDQPKPEKPGPEHYTKMELLGFVFQYTEYGKTDDAYINNLINNYLQTGSTGDDRWDEWIKPYEKYLKGEGNGELPNPVDPDGKKPGDYDQSKLMTMLYSYMNTGSTGDKYLDGLIDNYLMTGSTGDADWDKWLEPYKQMFFPDPGGNGSGPNASGKYPYFITVTLKYKEALKDAELDRKGLDKDAKIEKVEVFK